MFFYYFNNKFRDNHFKKNLFVIVKLFYCDDANKKDIMW